MKCALTCVFLGAVQACSSGSTSPGHESLSAHEHESGALAVLTSIELPLVEGRIDHLALDLERDRLWIAALENGSLECVNTRTSEFSGKFTWPTEPQGVVIVGGRAWATDGERGRLLGFDVTETHSEEEPKVSIDIGADADNVRAVAATKMVVVGYGHGGLAIVDPSSARVVTRIALDAHPESFQIDARGKWGWVNLPGSQSIAVVDFESTRVVRTIHVAVAHQNYPMALVESDRRLLVGCREPSRLLVYELDTETLAADLPLSGDVDDIFVDEARGLVYASCGAGFVDVFERVKRGEWKLREKLATAAGARTCLFVPERERLYVAVPRRGTQRAEIRVFATGN